MELKHILFMESAAMLFNEKHSFIAFDALQFLTLLKPVLLDNMKTDANTLSLLFHLVTGSSLSL